MIRIIHKAIRLYNKRALSYYEAKDKRINRKILVIESDDWGSIRVPSLEVKKHLIKQGYNLDTRVFARCDTLESNYDIEALYDVLSNYKDINGHPPIITANSVVANPNFSKIKDSGFSTYFFEPSSETYLSYPDCERSLNLLKKGEELGYICIQSHGREHINYQYWLKLLRSGNEDVRIAFDMGMCWLFPKTQPTMPNPVVSAYEYASKEEKSDLLNSISMGLSMFERQFGHKSCTFVAPCFIWSDAIEEVLRNHGVIMIQSDRIQKDHTIHSKRDRVHYMGEKNRFGQVYSIRNCIFEPAINRDGKEMERCLAQVSQAFETDRIAVISSHRINYVGGIIPENRTSTLNQLKVLLDMIIKKYPDVEFMSSPMVFESFFD